MTGREGANGAPKGSAGVLGRDRGTLALVGVLVAVAVLFVASSLRAPEVTTYTPTSASPVEVGEAKAGPTLVTVDASEGWRFFDFSRGSVVDEPDPDGWDLAVQRFRMVVNGGAGFAGRGGARELGELPFDSVRAVPTDGYVSSVADNDSTNAALEDWYDYSWTSHLLSPRPVVYAVRTADGRYAKLEILGYYCDGARPGCMTFRYVYQGGGGTDVS